MKKAILFSIWIADNCNLGAGYYIHQSTGNMYWIEADNMRLLYKVFEASDFYKNSI